MDRYGLYKDPLQGDAPARGGVLPRSADLAVHVEHGLAQAEQALPRVESVLRTLHDNYLSRGTPNEVLTREMLPQVVSRGFEFGAMRGQPQADHSGRNEPMRILRDGRLLATEHHRGGDGGRTGEARGEGTTEARRAAAMAGRLMGAHVKGGEGAERRPELALFEKIFMAHFEGGIPIGEKLEKGHFKFLAKSEKGWVEFFKKFMAFTMERKGNLNNVQALVVRGILKPDGTLTPQAKAMMQKANAQGVLVSDLKFANGKTDKFARLLIQNPQVMAKIASMAPGEVISHDLLMQWAEAFGGSEFAYQALSHKVVNPEAVKDSQSPVAEAYQTPEQMKGAAIRDGVRDSTQGIALSARTEQAVAERLEINLNRPTRVEIGLDRRAPEAMKGAAIQLGGLFSKKKRGLFGGGADDATGGGVFVPWYQHIIRPQKFKGRPRWWVPLLYFAAASAVVLSLTYIFRYWLNR